MRVFTVTLLLCAMLAGCGHPLIDSWADRGVQGVDFARANTEEFAAVIQKMLLEQRTGDIDAAFADILAVANGEIEGVKIDAAWLEDHKAGLLQLLAAADRDEATLDEATKKALANLDQVVEAFEKIKTLRQAWSVDRMQAQIDQLSALVLQVLRERNSQ